MKLNEDNLRNVDFTRKRKKYYYADEVDGYLNSLADSLKEQDAELQQLQSHAVDNNKWFETLDDEKKALERDLADALTANEAFSQDNQALRERLDALQARLAELTDENGALSSQKDEMDRQGKEQLACIAQLGDQLQETREALSDKTEENAHLSAEVERLSKRAQLQDNRMEELERMITPELIENAERRAREIVDKAIADSDRILIEVTDQRTRVIAASRAAYYNALQFKQELAKQFRDIERNLDDSIDVLRILDSPKRYTLDAETDP